MAGKLSTHVLDTYHGKPAVGIAIELWTYIPQPKLLITATTNSDGRTDAPLLTDEMMRVGSYELRFQVGDYFRSMNIPLVQPPFLEVVPVRFMLSDPAANYHVPLLVSPWAYSTYRGS